jgi:uncharacterized ion transporter superfamily protein YfcC
VVSTQSTTRYYWRIFFFFFFFVVAESLIIYPEEGLAWHPLGVPIMIIKITTTTHASPCIPTKKRVVRRGRPA